MHRSVVPEAADNFEIDPVVRYGSNNAAWPAANPGWPPRNDDINGDGLYPDFASINPFVALLIGG